MIIILIVIIVISIILLTITIQYITSFNKLKRYLTKIEEASSGIDVALAKRYDVITKLVEVVKGYTKYEQETLTKVIELRNNMTIKEKNEANNKMDEKMQNINIIVEKYPDLKANENYKMLAKAIIDVEEHLQAARRLYNSNVSAYNQLVLVFPSNIIAKNNNMTTKEYFEASKEEKKEVKIDLDK